MKFQGFLGKFNLTKPINASALLENWSVLLDYPLVLLGSADSKQPFTAFLEETIWISHVIWKIEFIFSAISWHIGPKIMPKT